MLILYTRVFLTICAGLRQKRQKSFDVHLLYIIDWLAKRATYLKQQFWVYTFMSLTEFHITCNKSVSSKGQCVTVQKNVKCDCVSLIGISFLACRLCAETANCLHYLKQCSQLLPPLPSLHFLSQNDSL